MRRIHSYNDNCDTIGNDRGNGGCNDRKKRLSPSPSNPVAARKEEFIWLSKIVLKKFYKKLKLYTCKQNDVIHGFHLAFNTKHYFAYYSGHI